MIKTTFAKVPVNTNFQFGGDQKFYNKIDDARYILIGENGAYCLDPSTEIFIEG